MRVSASMCKRSYEIGTNYEYAFFKILNTWIIFANMYRFQTNSTLKQMDTRQLIYSNVGISFLRYTYKECEFVIGTPAWEEDRSLSLG